MSTGISRMQTRVKGFDDPEMEFQYLRALGVIPAGGGAIGECLAARAAMSDDSIESWVREWTAMARRCLTEAESCQEAGQRVSARDLYLRASMYFRGAEYFAPITSPQHRELGLASRDAFQAACPLHDPPVQVLSIPFESTPPARQFRASAGCGGPGQDPGNLRRVRFLRRRALLAVRGGGAQAGHQCLDLRGAGPDRHAALAPGYALSP